MPSENSRPSKKRNRGDHAYASPWNDLNFSVLERLDSEPAADSQSEIASIGRGIPSSRGAPIRRQNPPATIPSPLLHLCPVSLQVSIGKCRKEWLIIEAETCVRIMDEMLQLTDQQMMTRFARFFNEAVSVIDKVRGETATTKRKEILSTELYRLISSDDEWDLVDEFAAQTLSQPERRHSMAMIVEFFLQELLKLTADDVESPAEEPAENSAPSDEQKAMEEQALYYVGGFLIRKLLKKFDAPDSSISSEVKRLLKECVADRNSEKPQAAEWTSAVDRGGLVFINQECLDLFASIEKCAAAAGGEISDRRIALSDSDVDAAVYQLAFSIFGDYTTAALDRFKEVVVQEFFALRGKAVARRLIETAILSDSLLQERRGLRSKLLRQETSRTGNT